MSTQKFFIQPADRIAQFKPYFFATLNPKIASLRANGMDVIRIDMGSPDLPPEEGIIDALIQSALKPTSHGYTPNGGSLAFRQAIATYYLNRFNVELDPAKEAIALVGSKEGLFNLSQVILNPGDVVLIPDPGYPVYRASGEIAGAECFTMPLLRENNFLPDLDSIPEEIARRAKMMWLNYPNNPTGAVAPFAFLEKAVAFGQKYQILIAHDAPYADVCFDGYIAPSILQVPGAKEVCLEFNSLSKAYNMAGWRLGMAVGNPDVIRLLHTYKSQMDSSQFDPVLQAGIYAMTGDQTWLGPRNKTYENRRDIVLAGLRTAGFSVDTPPAAIYVWAHLPEGYTDSISFCDQLLHEAGVSMTPGDVYGEYGKGYVRISLGAATDRMQTAMHRLVEWMKTKDSKKIDG
jgi:LL-diaminopimelate aminotransferase